MDVVVGQGEGSSPYLKFLSNINWRVNSTFVQWGSAIEHYFMQNTNCCNLY